MPKRLSYGDAISHWRRNDEVKEKLDRRRDPDGLRYGLYDDFPPWLNRYYAHFQRRVVERFLGKLALPEQVRALEVGCGSGRWCHLLARRSGWAVAGVDVATGTLTASRRIYGRDVDFVGALASALPVADGTVDLAYSVAALHHLPFDVQAAALAEIHRVLKPGGALFFLESAEVDASSTHLYPRESDDWLRLTGEQGFNVVDVTGQEYIDFRRIIRPLRRALRRSLGGSAQRPSEPGPSGAVDLDSELSLQERLFCALFFPAVLLAYPLERVAMKSLDRRRAHYICVLARREPDPVRTGGARSR